MNERNNREVLRAVVGRFPKSGPTIRTLFHENQEFRELCGDYAECMAVLDRLRRGQGAADERIEQYCELRVDLERELLGLISESAHSGPGSPKGDCKRIVANDGGRTL